MYNAEFIKRYVRIGIGVRICSGLSLEPDDRDSLGVIEIDHLLSDPTIGVYILKGKFQGNAVLNFIAGLRKASRGR